MSPRPHACFAVRRPSRLRAVLPVLVTGLATTHALAGAGDPVVTVHFPNGGESLNGGDTTNIVWTATDDTAVTLVNVYYRDGAAEEWTPIALGLADSGALPWSVHNTPTSEARVRVVAEDPFGNTGEDQSDTDFTINAQTGSRVSTTLRDFEQPGTQPFEAGFLHPNSNCLSCHSGYADHSPGSSYLGSMMANAARDPLFYAALAIAEQDAASSGDLCIRCHSPYAWVNGRSNPTDAGAFTTEDREGITCHFCHKLVDPVYTGENPADDVAVLDALDEVPTEFGSGRYVVDPEDRRRGPYSSVSPPHQWRYSPFHNSSDLCATCHDVSNPAFERVGPMDYALGSIDAPPADFGAGHLFPVERTYSEWLASDFVSGVFAPEFAGNRPDGIVSTCQDCHMADVLGKGCGFESAPERSDLGVHDLTGGNTWMPQVIKKAFASEIVPEYMDAATLRAQAMLEKAAVLSIAITAEADSFRAHVTVTNRSGHRLPTGYPEGRRMWVNLAAYDGVGTKVYESGAYDVATAELTYDSDLAIYEAELGLSPSLAASLGLPAGPSFHFVLNDTLYKDTRIPPLGFTNAAFEDFGMPPVDPDHEGPGPRYEDGQNWDTPTYALPASAAEVIATLYYQTTSKEYVEFLRDENVTSSAGSDMYDLWVANGRAAPVVMAADTTSTDVIGVPGHDVAAGIGLDAIANPFRGPLALRLDLAASADVSLEVYDVHGRRIARERFGEIGGGAHRLVWDGTTAGGHDAGPGVYFARVRVGDRVLSRRAVRLD